MKNVNQPKDTKSVGNVEAIRCYFGPDRPVVANELKELSSEERHELARLACEDMGWTHCPPAV
jgi:hypothetical protein